MKERFRYKKEMGQHFLFDPGLIEALADAARVGKEDGVLEIGPGRGTLTTALARRARRVITVELDRTLLSDLEVTLALYPNVEIVQGDILRQDLAALVDRLGTPCRVAANLPYNITTPLMEKLLHAHLPLSSVAVMVQKEMGERMLAQPGEDGYGPLSLLIGYFTAYEDAIDVPAACFTPPPKVDSTFLVLSMRDTPAVQVRDETLFFRVIRAAFAMRRKTILNNLISGFSLSREEAASTLDATGIRPNTRAEEMPMQAFAELADTLLARRAAKQGERM
ncbi:16S rRNA (adenine(1518)-N(6)/adenine(1519)-N(6))-dimethyltransferase RsmA [Eubacteriales bacterium OttesenSCG-928-A19]|nr:16S rRNA (adenine(1518)-N(6)/adenine(1519)-N(6))-dimethyltransferase RsmA [Eubacteriales bacterium OttesenSCG-928-A19]